MKVLNLLEFSSKWIDENVGEFYPEMKDDIRDFVALLVRQNHSGASITLFMDYIYKMMKDYRNQK